MVFLKQFVIYGGSHGKIHLLRRSSLGSDKSIVECKQTEMGIGKTYMSQISFINQMELSWDGKYLFVAGSVDQCIVKYVIVQQRITSDLDYTAYETEESDPG